MLGQGDAAGEAYVAFQRYALRLKERGILLAVCSKNDEANARLPFEQHPEMVLKRFRRIYALPSSPTGRTRRPIWVAHRQNLEHRDRPAGLCR